VVEVAVAPRLLPVGSEGRHASGWWGMLALVVTEAALFAYLLFSYFYVASQAHAPWPPDGMPSLLVAVPNTIILIMGSFTVRYGERGIQRDDRGRLMKGLLITLILGFIFLGLQGLEWHNKTFSMTSGIYGSLYFTITGFHMVHVLVGLVMIAVLALWTSFDYFGARRHAAVSIGAIYWHFVTVVWLAVFATFYIAPYLG